MQTPVEKHSASLPARDALATVSTASADSEIGNNLAAQTSANTDPAPAPHCLLPKQPLQHVRLAAFPLVDNGAIPGPFPEVSGLGFYFHVHLPPAGPCQSLLQSRGLLCEAGECVCVCVCVCVWCTSLCHRDWVDKELFWTRSDSWGPEAVSAGGPRGPDGCFCC